MTPILSDTIIPFGNFTLDFKVFKLDKTLAPGDSLNCHFQVQNKPNTWLRNNSPVRKNGTFIQHYIYPRFGYWTVYEKSSPSDSAALVKPSESIDADWVEFETTVSTSKDQIALAPGYLQKEWIENDRRYFHYKMDTIMPLHFGYNSAKYAVKKENWKGIELAVYYHPSHDYNVEHFMDGMKASLSYNISYFSPYQHRQARVIEFPRSYGVFARSFPNTFPCSEALGFIAKIDEEDEGGRNDSFFVTAHEMAHQWWMHQVLPADVLGDGMILEGLTQYVALSAIKRNLGKLALRTFMKDQYDWYLRGRSNEKQLEPPLMFVNNQSYIMYAKGALVFNLLSDYIGEEKLNRGLKKYVQEVAFQNAPFTTSVELVDHIREIVPDSLSYLIKDLFETVTLYQNKISSVQVKPLASGKYQVDIEFLISKYRTGEKNKPYFEDEPGKKNNLPGKQ